MLFARTLITEYAVKFLLEQEGLSPVSLSVDRVGLQGVAISGLKIGADSELYIGSLELDYKFLELIQGHVENARVKNGLLKAQLRENRLSFGVLDGIIGIAPSIQSQNQGELPGSASNKDDNRKTIKVEFSGDLNGRNEAYVVELDLNFSFLNNAISGSMRASFAGGDIVSGTLLVNNGEWKMEDMDLYFSDAQFSLRKPSRQVFNSKANILLNRVTYKGLDQISKKVALALVGNVINSDHSESRLKTSLKIDAGLSNRDSYIAKFSATTENILDDSTKIDVHGELDVATLGIFPTIDLLDTSQISGRVVVDYEMALTELMTAIDVSNRFPNGSGEVLFELESRQFPSKDGKFGVSGVIKVAGQSQGLQFETKEPLLFSDVVLPDTTLELEDMQISGTLTTPDQISLKVFPFMLADKAEPPMFGRVGITAEMTTNARGTTVSGTISTSGGQELFGFTGRHRVPDSTGSFDFQSDKLKFGQNGLDLLEILPVLRGSVTEIKGQVEANVTLSWSNDNFKSSADMELMDMGFHSSVAEIQGISGALKFDSLYPLSTPPKQKFTIGFIYPGVELRDGVIEFSIRDDQLLIDNASSSLHVGKLSMKQETYDFNAKRQKFTINAENLDLKKFFELVDIDGLSATGSLSGEIPIVIGQNQVYIINGRLTSASPGGTIRYRSTVKESISTTSQSDLLFRLIEDFHYRTLSLDINGKLSDELEVMLQIDGSSPGVYDGYPVKLNISVDLPVESIAKGMVGDQIPQMIQQRFRVPTP